MARSRSTRWWTSAPRSSSRRARSTPTRLTSSTSASTPSAGAPTENLLLFPISTWDSRSHPLEVEFDVYIDVDQDGVDDYVAYNGTLTFAGDPRAVSVLVNLAAGTATAQFFLDTTLNSGVMVIPVVVPDADMAFNFQVYGYDCVHHRSSLWDTSPADALDGAYHVFDAMAPAFYADEYYPEVPAGCYGHQHGDRHAQQLAVADRYALPCRQRRHGRRGPRRRAARRYLRRRNPDGQHQPGGHGHLHRRGRQRQQQRRRHRRRALPGAGRS